MIDYPASIGDILLCSGKSFLSRRIIGYNKIILRERPPAANLSHVAMIGPSKRDVFEATTYNKWCGKKGVQINPYKDWLANYPGSVWVRKAKIKTVLVKHQILMMSRMLKLVGTPYENGIPGVLELALAGIKLPFISGKLAEKLRTEDAVHCSESLGDVLRHAELFSTYLRINKLPPCLWWDGIPELDEYYETPEKIK